MNLQKHEYQLFLDHIERYQFIAHRLGFLMEGYPENSLQNVESLLTKPEVLNRINGIEFDIQFTKDHVPVITHDSSTADISEITKIIRKTEYQELERIKCGYRRSDYNHVLPWEKNHTFHLGTLDAILELLADHRNELADKIIKIETKSPYLKKEDLFAFKQILDRYQGIRDNIRHISFFPWNLSQLRALEKEKNAKITRTELLIDFYLEKPITKIWDSSIDGISLGLKNERIEGNLELSEEAKRMASSHAAFYERRDAVHEKWLENIIKKYGYAGIYTINSPKDIEELLERVSPQFLDTYADQIMITSDNPVYLKKLR